jgi:hypothetical protein
VTNKIFFPIIHPKNLGACYGKKSMAVTFMYQLNSEATLVANVVHGMETGFTRVG